MTSDGLTHVGIPFRDLVSPGSRISRQPFLCWGLVLAAIKIPIDFVVTEVWLGREWSPTR